MDEVKRRYRNLMIKHGFAKRVSCSKEENAAYRQMLEEGRPLPDEIYRSEDTTEYVFYRYESLGVPEAQIDLMLRLQMARDLWVIKGCVIFFTVLAAIGLAFILLVMS